MNNKKHFPIVEKCRDAIGTMILFIMWSCVNYWQLIIVDTVLITTIIFLFLN